MHYLRELNFWGHTRENQGFQMFANYWIGHAHNIYLQYATDFGLLREGFCYYVYFINNLFSEMLY